MHEPDEDELTKSEMSFGDHLEELRGRIFKAVLSTVVVFIIAFVFREPIMRIVTEPYVSVALDLRRDPSLKTSAPQGSFIAYLKVSFVASMLIAAPLWMYQFWAFIAAGLYRHERRIVYRSAPPMAFLFFGGVLFGYEILIPIGLNYLLTFADPTLIQNWIQLGDYLSVFTTLTLVLGVTFQLPIVMSVFSRLEMVSSKGYRDKRRYFIIIAFIVGALLTPPDAITQALMAAPLLGLYEVGIVLSWIGEGNRLKDLDWRIWRRRLAIGLVALALIAVFFDNIVEAYRARRVAERLLQAEDDTSVADSFPYMATFAKVQWLGFAPDRAFRLDERSDEVGTQRRTIESWLIGDGQRSVLADVTFVNDVVLESSEESNTARFLVVAGAQSVAVSAAAGRLASQWMPDFLDHLAASSAADFRAIESLLFGLTGERPAGLAVADADASASARADLVEAWRDWLKSAGADWSWVPK